MIKTLISVVDAVLPRRCPVCSHVVHTHDGFCASCWTTLAFIGQPCCDSCGEPFELPALVGQQCGVCLAMPPPWQQARSVWRYDDASRPVITALKYADRTELARLATPSLIRAGGVLLQDETAILVPVPLHRWRFFRRTYNQAALLVTAVAAKSGHKTVLDGLQRIRRTPPQQGLTRLERQRNVAKAFRVNPRHLAVLRGKTIILVDDVLTTGATLGACTKALLNGGAATVHVLTLARVVGQRTVPI